MSWCSYCVGVKLTLPYPSLLLRESSAAAQELAAVEAIRGGVADSSLGAQRARPLVGAVRGRGETYEGG